MPEQTMLDCVSCESTFDPTPNGGFCPDCDTPHPEYEQQDAAVESGTDGSGAEDPNVEEAEAEPGADSSSEVESDANGSAAEVAPDEQVEADDGGAESGTEPTAEGVEDESSDDEPEGDASKTVCPDCGAIIELDDEAEDGAAEDPVDDESNELTECPDCGHSITDEAYCPNCGTHLDEIRTGEDEASEEEVSEEEVNEEEADAVPETITLVIDGESFTFGDGDTFGRQDGDWLDTLVSASGGPDEVAYISGNHLEFTLEDDGIYVTDVSRNGTVLNGAELNGGKAKLEDGDTLELAERAEIDVAL